MRKVKNNNTDLPLYILVIKYIFFTTNNSNFVPSFKKYDFILILGLHKNSRKKRKLGKLRNLLNFAQPLRGTPEPPDFLISNPGLLSSQHSASQ